MAGIPAVLLVLGLLIIGCDNGKTDDTNNSDTTDSTVDTWAAITDFNQLDGTWKGSYIQDETSIINLIEEQGLSLDVIVGMFSDDPTMQIVIGALLENIKVTISADITIKVNANAETQETSVVSTAAFSGRSINDIWPYLEPYLEIFDLGFFDVGAVTVTSDNDNHSIRMTSDSPPVPLPDDLLTKGLQISQNGRKIKVPADSLVPGMPEMIFDKQ